MNHTTTTAQKSFGRFFITSTPLHLGLTSLFLQCLLPTAQNALSALRRKAQFEK
jgi:hypothetical protein